MRFLISASEEIMIDRGCGEIGFFPVVISAYDGEDSSQSFVEQLDCLFLDKYGENANNYFKKFNCLRRKSAEFYSHRDSNSVGVLMFGKVLETLLDILGSEVRIRVEFRVMKVKYLQGYTQRGAEIFSQDAITFPSEHQVIASKEMIIDYKPGCRCYVTRYSCRDNFMQIPSVWKPYLGKSNPKVALCGKLKVEVSTCGFNYTILSASERCLELSRLNRVIFEEAILTDAVVIGENGTEVKCHRNFLAARSRVLATKVLNDGREPTTYCRVEMNDMSEESINAFLSYLYLGDLSAARENPQIMSDLLNAGQKYEIKSLVEDVQGINFL